MPTASGQPITPERLMQFTFGFAPPLIIEAAIRHQVFDALEGGAKTVDTLSAETRTSPRGVRAIVNALVGLELLERDDRGRYALTPESATFGASAHLPHRLALLSERARAFGAILALGDLLVEITGIGHERRREGRHQPVQPNRRLHGERRAVADHLRHLLTRGDQLLARHHLVDDRLTVAFVGGESAVAQREKRPPWYAAARCRDCAPSPVAPPSCAYRRSRRSPP